MCYLSTGRLSVTRYVYSRAGKIAWIESRGKNGVESTVEFLYDGSCQLRTISAPVQDGHGAFEVRFEYDADGRRISRTEINADGIAWESDRYNYRSDGSYTQVAFAPRVGADGGCFWLPGFRTSIEVPLADTLTISCGPSGNVKGGTFHDKEHRVVGEIVVPDEASRVASIRYKSRNLGAVDGLLDILRFLAPRLAGSRFVTLEVSIATDESGDVRTSRIHGDFVDIKTRTRFDQYGDAIEELRQSQRWVIAPFGRATSDFGIDAHWIYEYERDQVGNWTRQEISDALNGSATIDVVERSIAYFA